MQSNHSVTATLLLIVTAGAASAQTDQTSRVGTCDDARSQMEYFCEEKESNSNDMMLGFNACANAKKNVKEACEGVVEPDVEYKFEKKQGERSD